MRSRARGRGKVKCHVVWEESYSCVLSGLASQHCAMLQADGGERRDRKREKFGVASLEIKSRNT